MLQLRPEQPGDYQRITEIIDRAFSGQPYAGGDESEVVIRLRQQKALTLGLVASLEIQVVGHIAFSPASASDGSTGWYALGPVAVAPEYQSEGVGATLINEGLAQLQRLGAVGCMLTGNPDYYRRFGFEFAPEQCPVVEQAEYFLLKRLTDDALPVGPMSFHSAFYGA